MSEVLTNCHCKHQKVRIAKRSSYPIFMGVLIALLPKCPFCVLAYSSAITMCGVNAQAPTWTSWISIGLAVITLIAILLNYRGWRTWLAVSFVLVGSILIMFSELSSGDLTHYYQGVVLLIFGVWMNASFLYFFRKIKERLLRIA